MLTLTCDDCNNQYEVGFANGKLTYQVDNKIYTLKSEIDPCFECKERIKLAISREKENIRKEKKLHGTN